MFAAVIALAVAGTFAVGAARPMEGPAARRFATTHWIAGALMVLPLVVAMIAQVVQRVGEGRSGDAASTTAFAIVVAVVPLAGIFASRRESPPLVVGSAVLGILWVLFGALLFVGLGVGMAGLSA